MGLKARLDRAFFRLPTDDGTVQLSQSRVYLLPSGRGLAVAVTGLVMLLVGVNYGTSLAYLAAFLIAGYLVCALIAAFRNLVNLRIVYTGAEDAHAGESVKFKFALETERDRYFVTLASAEDVVMVDRARLGATPASLSVMTTERGTKTLGRVMVQSIAPTGLIRAFSYIHFPTIAHVYPSLLRPAPMLPPDSAVAHAQHGEKPAASQVTTRAAAGDALDGLREYHAGDSLARVAWASLARGQAWRSKLLATEAPTTRTLRWAQTAHLGGDINARLSALATWIAESHRRGEAYGLSIPGLEIPSAQHAEHRIACLRALARAAL